MCFRELADRMPKYGNSFVFGDEMHRMPMSMQNVLLLDINNFMFIPCTRTISGPSLLGAWYVWNESPLICMSWSSGKQSDMLVGEGTSIKKMPFELSHRS